MAFLSNFLILAVSALKAFAGGVVEDPVAAFAVVLFSMVDLLSGWGFSVCLFCRWSRKLALLQIHGNF